MAALRGRPLNWKVIAVKDKIQGKAQELGQQLQQATSGPKGKPIHVVHKSGKWAVEQEGQSSTPLSQHATRAEAVGAGKELARQHKTELIVHREDGTIGERDSYGGESAHKG